ncbi:glycoside hydrolase domain-containing protein [Streptomyces sp. NPDC005706]|uniref:glycoside hydrolase domain-containing protein n=1 Tax=Streptomyces sp. NPDC005706 TaxID=3157169 RepID=UPI0033E5630B
MTRTTGDGLHPELDCSIGHWDSRLFGNHRIIVTVPHAAPAVRVILPWRRKDQRPERVDLIVVAAATSERVRNVVRLYDTPHRGDVVFEPIAGAGEYYFYYLPYALVGGRNYPDAHYLPWRPLENPTWRRATGIDDPGSWSTLPLADATTYQAVSAHDSFAPMGFPASPDEVASLHRRSDGKDLLVFPELRSRPIEMIRHVPAVWLHRDESAGLAAQARRGEAFAFQVGVYALRDVDVSVHTGRMPFCTRSLMTEGVRADGTAFDREALHIPAGEVRALWFLVEVPTDCAPGTHTGTVVIDAEPVRVTLDVSPEAPLLDGGVRRLQSMARLSWLDSTLAHDHTVVDPYVPVSVDAAQRRLDILGRRVHLGSDGLPEKIVSTFSEDGTSSTGCERNVLAGPICWDFGTKASPLEGLRIASQGPATATWEQTLLGESVTVTLAASLEADGCLQYRCLVTAGDHPVHLPDVRLTVPIHNDVAQYSMGLGRLGGKCPDSLEWRWDVANKNQDALWVGDTNAGLQLSLWDDRYRRPLNSNWYKTSPLVEPRSWGNGGRGGIKIERSDTATMLEAYSGPLNLAAGEDIDFSFRILITPFKTLATSKQARERYYHAPNRIEEISGYGARPIPINHPGDPQDIRDYGATVVNVHHATTVMPHINDPMLSADSLEHYVRDAHAVGLRVKVYNTVRELPTDSPEVHALMALDGEIYAQGPALGPRGMNVGHIWLQEHLPVSFVPGYASSNTDDRPIVTSGESRWLNVYVRMIDWLAQECRIDGIYLDEVGFDRTTMKRVRKVLSRHRPEPLIDLHSASQFQEADGFASSANLYLEHFPYVDRLWFSEYVDYDAINPVQWLLELSGIPFGLMGEMLENGGNPWKGLLFGATARAPRVDVAPLWRFWDTVRLADTRMIGWWSSRAPVSTDDESVLATSWVGNGYAVIALASWAPSDVEVRLLIDYAALGIAEAVIESPEIEGFQAAITVSSDDKVFIPYNQGRVLVIREAEGVDA